MTAFFKTSGANNDFIALVEPDRDPTADEIVAWCRRRESLGADGVFVIRRRAAGVIEMAFFNRDGGRASLCLNGARCAARLAFDRGWGARSLRLATDAGEIRAHLVDRDTVRLDVPIPDRQPEALSLSAGGRSWAAHFTVVGVPHLVVPCEGLESLDIEAIGSELRHHPRLGADGANVMFVSVHDPHRVSMRSYERGVEGETAACGTGALAVVQVGLTQGWLRLPVVAQTRSGHELEISGDANAGRLAAWSLSGDARIIARGELLPGALRAARAPSSKTCPHSPQRC